MQLKKRWTFITMSVFLSFLFELPLFAQDSYQAGELIVTFANQGQNLNVAEENGISQTGLSSDGILVMAHGLACLRPATICGRRITLIKHIRILMVEPLL